MATGMSVNPPPRPLPNPLILKSANGVTTVQADDALAVINLTSAGSIVRLTPGGVRTYGPYYVNSGSGSVTIIQTTGDGLNLGLYGVAPVARAAAVSAPNVQTAAYVQADVQSLVTAVNAIRAALTAIGITL